MLDPKGRVVMLSGASRGIGAAIARKLLAQGYNVSAGVRTPARMAPAPNLFVHAYEAREPQSPREWVAATAARFGRIDALVNAAGINPPAPIEEESEDAIDAMWLVNVKGPLRLCRAALPHLKAAGTGRIVNIASLSGKRVRNVNVGYAMSKFALMALTHGLRRLGDAHGLRVSALCPGFVATDMTLGAQWPREQMSSPDDLAELAEMLIRLPNNATVAELLVNCRVEDTL
ncbi:MAG: SDR family NAD(P)-dependent oxidoreductase [Alphaproteobacteria bacterium]|nr:SDR family NAD(P)-dependent oxidoreductase [Alphaproteobacteria bacterium]